MLKKKENFMLQILELIFIFLFIFGTKIYFFTAILLGIYMYITEYKNKKNYFFIFLNKLILYKFLLGNLLSYGNLKNESFRFMIGVSVLYLVFRNKKFFREKNYLKWSFLFVISFLLGILFNYFSPGNIRSVKIFIEDNKYLLVPFLLINSFLNKKYLIKKLEYYVSLVGIVYFFKSVYWEKIESLGFIKGNLISAISIALPFSFFIFLKEKNIKKKIIFFSIFIANLWIVVISGARGSLYSSLIVISFILVLNNKLKKILLYISFLGVTFYFLNKDFKNVFFRVKDFSTRSREYLMRAGIYCFKKNIFFGSGSGNTQKYLIDYSNTQFLLDNKLLSEDEVMIVKNDYLVNFPDSHNIFIDMLAQNGVYGVLAILLLFLFLPFKIFISYLKEKKMDYLVYMSGIGGYLIAGQSWSLWDKHSKGMLSFIVIITMYLLLVKGNDCVFKKGR